MGLSNMLSKLFKKENADIDVQVPVKFKDFDSIIVPPEPKTRGLFLYKTLDLGLEFAPQSTRTENKTAGNEEDAVLLTDDMVETTKEED